MLLDIIKTLESTGARVQIERSQKLANGEGVSLVFELDKNVVEFSVEERQRSPYVMEVTKLGPPHPRKKKSRARLLAAPFVSPAVGDALIVAGWSWADAAGNFDIKARGLRLRQRLTKHSPPSQRRDLPKGAGSTAIIRWLLSNAKLGERIVPTKLTAVGGVSQPRVSQLLQSLARLDLVAHVGREYKLEAVEPLLDAFLRDYRGPGGSQRFAYTLDAPNLFTTKATDVLHRTLTENDFAFSADVGPDLLASWRSPTHAIIYLRQSVALSDIGLVDAKGQEDANVLLRMPADLSIFSTASNHTTGSTTIRLVDVPQMIWDLEDLGGEDRHEAGGRLREWFIQHR